MSAETRMRERERKEIVTRLKRGIRDSLRDKESPDEASYGYETGILLTRRQAEVCLREIESPTSGGPE